VEKLDRFRRVLERERRQPHRLADLAVDGSDLIELGYRPGPELGRVLRDLLHEVVDDPTSNTRDRLLRSAERKRR
jgi:tRNA nucleotidyltransferase (CCA-adding enzyme)